MVLRLAIASLTLVATVANAQPGLLVAPPSLAVLEGSTATYTVRLNTQPSGAVTVTVGGATAGVAVDTDTMASGNQTTLSFTTTNWQTPQPVSVTATEDSESLTDSSATLTHGVTGYGGVSTGPTVSVTVRNATVDYDADGDGLIAVSTLAQLNAMRWDLNGDGTVDAGGNAAAYAAAYPHPRHGTVCPTATTGVSCGGYELMRNLDFDSNGDGQVNGDDPDSFANWQPIGSDDVVRYAAVFRGNGKTINNLTINRPRDGHVGLFGRLAGPAARIESLGVTNANVTGRVMVGILCGSCAGWITASYTTGRVAGRNLVGGLAGELWDSRSGDRARVVASYSTAAVAAAGTTYGSAVWRALAGGLVGGHFNGAIIASYAIGPVSSTRDHAGGLSGDPRTTYTSFSIGSIVNSYWDTETTGQTYSYATSDVGVETGVAGTAIATAEGAYGSAALKTPTGYVGIYWLWDVDLNDDDEADDPWDFGSSDSYPVLKCCGHAAAAQRPQPNSPPRAVGDLDDLFLDVGKLAFVELSSAFEDPDADDLVYTAVSSDASVAYVLTLDDSLQVVGSAAGAAEITVTATDPAGASAERTFMVTVGLALSLQEGASAPEGGIARVRAELSRARDAVTRFRWHVLADDDPTTADADAADHGDASGEAEIAAGATYTEIEVAVLDDAQIEPSREWFAVQLELLDGAVAAGRQRVAVAVQEGVCDRTAAVRDRIAAGGRCWAPSRADLALVRRLTLRRQGLAALAADDLLELSGLWSLDLRDNALLELPAELLADASELEHLRLAGNRLSALRSDAFSGLSTLRTLDLADNALAELPQGVFDDLRSLRWLYLNDNRLANLPAGAFANLGELGWLRVDGNDLEVLPDGVFAGLGSLRSLRLDRNPGSPFVLAVELERTDADPWQPGPATVRASMPSGAPFEVAVALSASGGVLRSLAGGATAHVMLAAGETASGVVLAEADGAGTVQISASVPALPGTRCDGLPCWRGLALTAGEPLSLFVRSPMPTTSVPQPDALYGYALRLPLAALVTAGDAPGELRWQASSSDQSLATARVVGSHLLVEPEPGAEGMVTIEVTATDTRELSATVRFLVRVEFYWPWRIGGWRGALPRSAGDD